MRGTQQYAEIDRVRVRTQRLRRAAARVMPLRDTAGTVYGYLVRGTHVGQVPIGPFESADEALKEALAQ